MTQPIKFHSPAKVNWLLRVGPPRPDGYHDICSVMQTLALGDTLTIRRRDDAQCRSSGFPADISPDKNLVHRAWRAMRDTWPRHIGGVDIHINKVMPQGGGLGGGSSNAATIIQALAKMFPLPAEDKPDNYNELRSIASTIGSDIPFFIPGGTAIVSGRGEHVRLLPASPIYHLVLLLPDQGMSTPEAYKQLDAATDRNTDLPSDADLDRFNEILLSGDPTRLADAIENDFERVSTHYDWFLESKQILAQAGVLRAFLCGSGSTVAGLCHDQESAMRIAANVGCLYTYTVPAPLQIK